MEDSFLYDVRVRDRLVKKGLLKQDVLQKHLDALTDVESQSESVSIEQPTASGRVDGAR